MPAPQPSNRCSREAIEKAQALLAFASSRGTPIEPEVAKAITDAGSTFPGGRMLAMQQVAFWEAVEVLSRTLVAFPLFLGHLA